MKPAPAVTASLRIPFVINSNQLIAHGNMRPNMQSQSGIVVKLLRFRKEHAASRARTAISFPARTNPQEKGEGTDIAAAPARQ